MGWEAGQVKVYSHSFGLPLGFPFGPSVAKVRSKHPKRAKNVYGKEGEGKRGGVGGREVLKDSSSDSIQRHSAAWQRASWLSIAATWQQATWQK